MYQVCPETNTVLINIGLLLLAFSNSDEEHCRYVDKSSSALHLQLSFVPANFAFLCFCFQTEHVSFQPAGQLGPKHRRVLHCGCW